MQRAVRVVAALLLFMAPLATGAQQAATVYRVGLLQTAPREQTADLVKAIFEGLAAFGYIDGRNLAIEHRSADGRAERLPTLAAELVRSGPHVIIPTSTPAALAVKQATPTIPIVMVSPGDPIGSGLVSSLARPGGNITGLTLEITPDTYAKLLQLLKEACPNVQRVAVLGNPGYRQNAARWQVTQQAARTLGVTLSAVDVRRPDDLNDAFATMKRERSDGLVILGDPVVFALRQQIGRLATEHRLPSISPYREAAEAGGLMAYGANFVETYRRVGMYVDKVLKAQTRVICRSNNLQHSNS